MRALFGSVLALSALAASPAPAQDAAASFYRGKQIELRIGFPPGSGYDLVGRLVAPYLTKHIPGHPTVVIQNVDGASSLALANQLASSAPQDGSVIGLVSNEMPSAPLLAPTATHYDPTKFHFVGTISPETDIVVVRGDAPVKSVADLFKTELVVGAAGVGGAIYELPAVMNALAGAKFKIVSGYAGSAQIELAMDRGEVQGIGGMGWESLKSHASAKIKDGSLRVVAQYGLEKNPDLPNVGLFDLPTDAADRQALTLMFLRQEYGRPFVMPPGAPADRVEIVRTAFDQAMKDPDFIAMANKAGLDVDPVSGAELDSLTVKIVSSSAAAVEKLKNVLDPKSTH